MAEKVDKRHVLLKITRCCEHIARMKTRLEKKPLDVLNVMSKISDSEIYKAADQCLPHTTCPVPSALSKLVEVEMGLAVPVDVSIRFEDGDSLED